MGVNNTPYYANYIVTSSGVEKITEIEQKSIDLNVTMGKVGTTARDSFNTAARNASRFLFTMQISLFYASMLTGALDSVRTSQLSLETAQERHLETLQKYGENSIEAAQSARQLEKAQIAVARASRLQLLNTVGMTFQVASLGVEVVRTARQTQFFKRVLDGITASHWLETAAVKAKSAAYTVLNAVMATNPVGLAILAAGLVGTGLLAYQAYNQSQQNLSTPNTETSITIEGSEFNILDGEEAISEDARRKLEQLRRIR